MNTATICAVAGSLIAVLLLVMFLVSRRGGEVEEGFRWRRKKRKPRRKWGWSRKRKPRGGANWGAALKQKRVKDLDKQCSRDFRHDRSKCVELCDLNRDRFACYWAEREEIENLKGAKKKKVEDLKKKCDVSPGGNLDSEACYELCKMYPHGFYLECIYSGRISKPPV